MGDTIRIEGLRANALIGVYAHERARARPLTVDATLAVDLRKAGASDDLADTVDYGALAEELVAIAAGSSFALLEALAERMADACLAHAGVTGVTVTIRKVGAVSNAAGVSVSVARP